MRTTALLMAVSLACGFWALGCGDKEDEKPAGDATGPQQGASRTVAPPSSTPGTPATPAETTPPAVAGEDTPKKAMARMRKALLAGDAASFDACFDDPAGKAGRLLNAWCEFAAAQTRFESAMGEAYGQAAADRIRVQNPTTPFAGETWMQDASFRRSFDSATVTPPDKTSGLDPSAPIELVRIEGKWKIRAGTVRLLGQDTSDQAVRESTQRFLNMASAMKEAIGKVGQSGYTAEKVMKELNAAMFEAM